MNIYVVTLQGCQRVHCKTFVLFHRRQSYAIIMNIHVSIQHSTNATHCGQELNNLELGLNSVLVDSASVCTYMHCVFMSTMQLQQRRCDEACHVRAEIYHDGVRHNGQSKSRTGASYFFVKAQSL